MNAHASSSSWVCEIMCTRQADRGDICVTHIFHMYLYVFVVDSGKVPFLFRPASSLLQLVFFLFVPWLGLRACNVLSGAANVRESSFSLFKQKLTSHSCTQVYVERMVHRWMCIVFGVLSVCGCACVQCVWHIWSPCVRRITHFRAYI